jgi:hypothetical protein
MQDAKPQFTFNFEKGDTHEATTRSTSRAAVRPAASVRTRPSPQTRHKNAVSYGAPEWSLEEGYLNFVGRDAHGEIPPEFWDHVEVVTEKKIPTNKRASYFSCGC